MTADSSELIMLQPGQSQAIEAFRVLRTNLQFASVGRPLHSLVNTSPAPREGKSWTAANLAVVLAQAGQRVTLVDADLHRPRQHRVFRLPNNVGLTTALLAAENDQNLPLQDGPLPGLRVLTSGPLPPNAAELLGSTRMGALRNLLCEISDIVIIDSPPVTALSDTAILASQSDGVLLILDATRTRRELAERALEGLRRVQAHVIGAVLNRMPARGGGYYYYYYHYTHYEDSDNGRNGHENRGGRLRRRLHQPLAQNAKQRKG
jgi:non-specific protein-tyrosine kinase